MRHDTCKLWARGSPHGAECERLGARLSFAEHLGAGGKPHGTRARRIRAVKGELSCARRCRAGRARLVTQRSECVCKTSFCA
jgi:hypothetical protein